MCGFLQGDDLSQKIREVVNGKDVRCAVAFWGRDAVRELFGTEVLDRDDVHVVCDLSMGGTNPETLRALGAPDNSNIRYLDGLHAKVFLSKNGAVVGSANASNNGIGFMGGNAQLLEAGTYFAPDSDGCRRIGGWFAGLSENRSRQVDDKALDAAHLAWNRRRRSPGAFSGHRQPQRIEFEMAIRNHPEIFGDLGFVFTRNAVNLVEREEALDALVLHDETQRNGNLEAFSIRGLDSLETSPRLFINFHRPNMITHVNFYHVGNIQNGIHIANRIGRRSPLLAELTGLIRFPTQRAQDLDIFPHELFDELANGLLNADQVSHKLNRR